VSISLCKQSILRILCCSCHWVDSIAVSPLMCLAIAHLFLTFVYYFSKSKGAFEDCMCGADICRGKIKGFKYNKDVLLEQYGGSNIAVHLMG